MDEWDTRPGQGMLNVINKFYNLPPFDSHAIQQAVSLIYKGLV